jgi:prepilin-type N-terminal cleavage/methylation domain-containing protein
VKNRPKSSRGYTLLEVLLVMSVLVVAASLAIVNISGLPDSYRLSRVSHEIRGFLTGLRARAMEEGTVMEFRFEPDYGSYEIRRGATSQTQATSNQDSSAGMEDVTLDQSDRIEFDSDQVFGKHELPKPLVFKSIDSNSGVISSSVSGSTNQRAIFFFPDGSCTGIEFWIDDGVSAMHVHVRALTGGVRTWRVAAEERNQK